MIKETFGVPVTPFKREYPQMLKHQQEVYDILLVHARQGGLNVIVGEPGTGKSVLKENIEKLGEGNNKEYVVVSIQRTIHTYNMIIAQLVDALGLPVEKVKAKEVEKAILVEALRINAMGKKLITIIDEAHLLDLDVLRKLRLLFDGFPRNHSIILFAQSEMLGRLAKRSNEDIKTRITYSAKLKPLTEEEAKEYIYREIQESELPGNVFEENAIDLIVRSAEGNLRLCKNLCYGSLVEVVCLKQRIVDIAIVNRVLVQPHWRKNDELDMGDLKK